MVDLWGGDRKIYESSDDGTTWVYHDVPYQFCAWHVLNSEMMDPTTFRTIWGKVYIGLTTEDKICISTDLENWTVRNRALRCIRYLNNQHIAVGSDGLIETSTDGNNWTVRDSGTENKYIACQGCNIYNFLSWC